MEKIQILIAMSVYMAGIIGIGFYYYKKANQSSDNYFCKDIRTCHRCL